MAPPTTNEDLLDLKMMPAWANEPPRPNDYANFEGEDQDSGQRRSDRPRSRDRRRDSVGASPLEHAVRRDAARSGVARRQRRDSRVRCTPRQRRSGPPRRQRRPDRRASHRVIFEA